MTAAESELIECALTLAISQERDGWPFRDKLRQMRHAAMVVLAERHPSSGLVRFNISAAAGTPPSIRRAARLVHQARRRPVPS